MTDTYEIKGDRLILQNEFGTLRLTAEQCDAIGKFARRHALDQLTAQAEEQGEYDEAPSPDYAVKDYNLLERMHKQEGASRDQADHFDAGWEACYTYYHINHLQHNQMMWQKYYDGAMKRANENTKLYQQALTNSENNAELYKAVHSQLQDANDLLQQAKNCFDLMKLPLVAKPIQDYFDKYKEPQ
jgi:hypothetical protein